MTAKQISVAGTYVLQVLASNSNDEYTSVVDTDGKLFGGVFETREAAHGAAFFRKSSAAYRRIERKLHKEGFDSVRLGYVLIPA